MKTTFTSVLLLALAGFCLLPEPATATPVAATTTTTVNTFSFGGNRRPTRKVKKVRGKAYHSSAARAHAKRTRRASF